VKLWSCFSNQALADLRARCSKWRLRAHSGSVKFLLRALAARKLPQSRKFLYCDAAKQPAIHADHRESETSTTGSLKNWSRSRSFRTSAMCESLNRWHRLAARRLPPDLLGQRLRDVTKSSSSRSKAHIRVLYML